MTRCDIVVVGAGPYGLAAAAHLREINGLDVHVFGEAMAFWHRHMPAGMLLRSNWTATQIASPRSRLSLEEFESDRGSRIGTPVPVEDFVEYGQWYQRHAIPDLDPRKIIGIERDSGGFRITPDSGETVWADRVVLAAGIKDFSWRPSEFARIGAPHVTHAVEHRDYHAFAGRDVLVIGSGQSALEGGALLHEAGARVEIFGRSSTIHWLQGRLSRTLHHELGGWTRKLLYAPTDVGPAGLSQLVARPEWLQKLPRSLQEKIRRRCVRPAGARWLVDRLTKVPITLGRHAVSAQLDGDRVEVTFDDGTKRSVDHVILATGYKPDIGKYSFVSAELRRQIKAQNGFPVLRPGMETSVAGLHVLGALGVRTFGPLLQFVSGTTYAARALTSCIAGQAPRTPRPGTILVP